MRVAGGAAFAAAALAAFASSPAACQPAPSTASWAAYEAAPAEVVPGRVRAEFLGTATVLLDDGETALMTDGFVTRPSLLAMATTKLKSDPARVEAALQRAGVGRLAAVLVAHSHLDHVLDTAAVAQRTGAVGYGSPSTANVLRGAGLPERAIRVFHDGDRLIFGRFEVRVIASPHSLPVSYPGEIVAPLPQPAGVGEFKEGGSFAFWVRHGDQSILIVPSANYTPGKFAGVRADTVFLGLGGLGKRDEAFADGYWEEAVRRTGARVVIPIHWDDFTLPLDQPLQPLSRQLDDFDLGMRRLAERARRDGVRIVLPRAFVPLPLGS